MSSRFLRFLALLLTLMLVLYSCEQEREVKETAPKREAPTPKIEVNVPDFDADSAFAYVKAQVDFGPRVPGSEAHGNCVEFLKQKLSSYGLKVIEQNTSITTYDRKSHQLRNVIASFKPESKKRVLLCAHYDTRPIADRGTERKDQPIDGANDGASGVGVLIEIARHLSSAPINIGLDIILFDLEDYGAPNSVQTGEETWCLGSQYWAANPHIPGYYAKYGVLLDMVGSRDAIFPREGTSMYYASGTVKKVWDKAQELGYASKFVTTQVGPITDDHLYINRLAAIPTIDIIHIDPGTGDFGPFHHTHDDNISLIDKETLAMVGTTLMHILYNEN